MNDRECPHTFNCWYRVEGRCCHSCVEDIPNCKGCEPSTYYVQLTNRAQKPIEKPASEEVSPAERLLPLPVRRMPAR